MPHLFAQLIDLPLSFLDRRTSTFLTAPPSDPFFLLTDAPFFGFDFLANLAIVWRLIGVHYESETAGLAGTVFSCAVCPEVAPFMATTSHTVLIIMAHFEDGIL